MNNKDGEELKACDQYSKLRRALNIVLDVNITKDEYFAVLQLMSHLDNDVCLILDNTHENI